MQLTICKLPPLILQILHQRPHLLLPLLQARFIHTQLLLQLRILASVYKLGWISSNCAQEALFGDLLDV